MTRQREEGYCSVIMMDGSGAYRLPRGEYLRVLSLWMSGTNAFIVAPGFYGSIATIKASRIEAVADWPPEALDAEDADVRAQRADDAIAGDG